MIQLSFDFPFEDRYLAEDFIVLPENKFLFDFVSNYDVKNHNLPKSFLIFGPESSGKTHLANIWRRKTKAEVINSSELEKINLSIFAQNSNHKTYLLEDIDKITNDIKSQKILFYLFNIIQENNSSLLVTSKVNLSEFNYEFPDIESRLKNIYNLKIQEPSTDLIKILLIKNFSLKQLIVQDQVIEYLSKNINRSFNLIPQITKLAEFHCFERKKALTIPSAKQLLSTLNLKNKSLISNSINNDETIKN